MKAIFSKFISKHDKCCNSRNCKFKNLRKNCYPFDFLEKFLCHPTIRTLDCLSGNCKKCSKKLLFCFSKTSCKVFKSVDSKTLVERVAIESQEQKSKNKTWMAQVKITSEISFDLATKKLEADLLEFAMHIHVRRETREEQKNLGQFILTDKFY